MKYKVGDKVKICANLRATEKNWGNTDVYVTEDMERFAGEVVTIEGIGENGRCGIEEDRGVGIWHLSMFEGLAGDEQTEETVKLYTWQDLCDYEILLHER